MWREEGSRGLDAGEVDPLTPTDPPARRHGPEGIAEPLECLAGRLRFGLSASWPCFVSRDPSHIGREVHQELFDAREAIALLDSLDVAVVSFRRVVVVKHGWFLVTAPHEREPVPHSTRVSRSRSHSPDHQFQNVSLFVDHLLPQDRGGTRHREPIYGIACPISESGCPARPAAVDGIDEHPITDGPALDHRADLSHLAGEVEAKDRRRLRDQPVWSQATGMLTRSRRPGS